MASDAGPDVRRAIEAAGRPVRLAAGTRAFASGAPCEHYIWVTAGTVRIQLVTESGREMTLYRVTPGECCVLTVSHLLRHEAYAAEGVCETDVAALLLPAAAFHDLLGRSEPFRSLVLSDYARRVADILLLMDTTASRAVPSRLAELVLDRTGPDGVLSATHHDLAVDLGSAREVVSRILKDWERQGAIALRRGRIELRDRSALSRMAVL